MFIKAPNARAGTGYTGDVNTAFRQGRQDAYRDYIDNFNFALRADAANNAENQNQVNRAYNNYVNNLNFDQNTRTAMINTVKDSQNLADNVFNFDVNTHRLDALYPQREALGKSQAVQFANTQLANETNSAYGAAQADYKLANVDTEAQGYKSDIEHKAKQAGMNLNSLNEAQNFYDTLVKRTQPEWERAFAVELARQYREANPDFTGTDSDIIADLRRSGNYDAVLQKFQEDEFRNARNNVEGAKGNVQNVVAPGEYRGAKGRVKSTEQDKIAYGKTENLDADKIGAISGGTLMGYTQDGQEVVALPGGDVLLRGKNGGRLLGATTVNGRLLSPEENLQYRNISITQPNNITRAKDEF